MKEATQEAHDTTEKTQEAPQESNQATEKPKKHYLTRQCGHSSVSQQRGPAAWPGSGARQRGG